MRRLHVLKLKKLTILFLFLITHGSVNFAQDLKIPERIILNLTDSPDTSMAITWRTGSDVSNAQAQIVLATAAPDLEKDAKMIVATSESLSIDENNSVTQHSVVFNGLAPNTLYAYRVGDGELWSEWSHFRTAFSEFHPFKFVFLGDPQNDLISKCSRIFRAAFAQASDARFWLLTGDIVNWGNDDKLWGEFFQAASWIPRWTPFVLLPGNHGYYTEIVDSQRIRRLNRLWRPQFTLPENGPEGLEESAYYFDYQGVRFVMLNGNEKLEEQALWLDELLSENPNRWTIVSIHQTFYSTGAKRDHVKLREIFIPVFDKHSVDLVLQGHDHTYGRTYKLRDGKIVGKNKKGTVYVVSVSGPKMYSVNPKFEHLMVKMGKNTQLFQVISVERDKLKFQCFTATGEIFDEFLLK